MNAPRAALLGLALSVPLALPAAPAAAQSAGYNFSNFDASGQGLPTTVNGLSNGGAVIGFSENADGTLTNFAGTPGALRTLDALNASHAFASANGINVNGAAVGGSGTGGAFILDTNSPSNQPSPLPLVSATTTSETAFGLNDSHVIVGAFTQSDGTSPGFVDAGGVFTALDPTGGSALVSAQGINNNGLVAGFFGAGADPNMTHGFLFDTGTGAYSVLPDPTVSDPSGLAFTQFLGINDGGVAVGYYQNGAGLQHGFLFDTATRAYTFLDDPSAAPGGSPVMQITGIADSGEIAGFFTDASGAQLGFTATPNAAPVPEASTLAGLGLLLGLGALGTARRRKAAA